MAFQGLVGPKGKAPRAADIGTAELLERLLRSGARQRLLAKLMAAMPHAERELTEDALQDVCEWISRQPPDKAGDFASEAKLFSWLEKTTLRRICWRYGRGAERFEWPMDWGHEPRPSGAGSAPSAEEQVLQREKQQELADAAGIVRAGLSERQREVMALHSNGMRRAQIASHLGLSRRTVKRLTEQSLTTGRSSLARAAGRGCTRGEQLVQRVAFGLASAPERNEAQLHVARCDRCGELYRRLEFVHDKLAALLPIPAAAQADPALLERALHKTADALAQAKQQLGDAASQVKQHTAAGYTRAVEYTPLASVRPGAAATAIAGCLALGGGAATYCIDRGVDPLSDFVDVVQPTPAQRKPQEPPKQRPAEQQPPEAPQLPASAPPTTPAPAPPQEPPAPAEPQPAATPAPPPPPPPPEPTPPAVQFGEPTNPGPAYTPSSTASPPPSAKPAPVPQNGGTDLYGP